MREMKLERFRTKELPYEGEKEGDITRRDFVTKQLLGGAATVAATTGVVAYANRAQSESVQHAPARPEGRKHHEGPPPNPNWWKSMAYATPKDLVGKGLNPLEVAYVHPVDPLPSKDEAHPDIPVLPETLGPIDFGGNLSHLLYRKRERLNLDPNKVPKDYEEQLATYERLQASYQEAWEWNEIRRMNIKQFEQFISREVAKTLQREGYVEGIDKKDNILEVHLKYKNKEPILSNVTLVSKPGLRVYRTREEIEKVKGPSIFVISTSKGVMSSGEAIRKGLGGEVIAKIL